MPKTKREFDAQAANEWPVANTPNLSALEARFDAIEFELCDIQVSPTLPSLSRSTERLPNGLDSACRPSPSFARVPTLHTYCPKRESLYHLSFRPPPGVLKLKPGRTNCPLTLHPNPTFSRPLQYPRARFVSSRWSLSHISTQPRLEIEPQPSTVTRSPVRLPSVNNAFSYGTMTQ